MMGLSASTYYYQPKVPRALRDQIEAELRDKIEHLQAESPVSAIGRSRPSYNAITGWR